MAEIAQKPSWQTKEFWLSVAAILVSVLLAVGGSFVEDPETSKWMIILGQIGAVLSALGYGGIRSMQKKSENDSIARMEVAKDLVRAESIKAKIPAPSDP
jgi:hypothetical protein